MPLKPTTLDDLELFQYERGGKYYKTWTWNDTLHSVEDHPSLIIRDGQGAIIEQQWHTHGMRHRDGDKPAWIKDDVMLFYKNGEMHRDDGPAWEGITEQKWYRHNQLHRLDGPAVEGLKIAPQWYLDGYAITMQQWGDDPRVDNELFVYFKLIYD